MDPETQKEINLVMNRFEDRVKVAIEEAAQEAATALEVLVQKALAAIDKGCVKAKAAERALEQAGFKAM